MAQAPNRSRHVERVSARQARWCHCNACGCDTAAGYEQQAQQAERLGQLQHDQRLADQARLDRENYQQQLARSAEWQQMGVLERMGHQPLSQEQIQAYRRQYGVSGR